MMIYQSKSKCKEHLQQRKVPDVPQSSISKGIRTINQSKRPRNKNKIIVIRSTLFNQPRAREVQVKLKNEWGFRGDLLAIQIREEMFRVSLQMASLRIN